MLRSLILDNFKSFSRPQNIDLAPITLLYGPNSSGKSSVIQSLLLMKQTIEAQGLRVPTLIPRGDFVDLGSFRSLISGHKVRDKSRPRAVRIATSYDLPSYSPKRMGSRILKGSDRVTVDLRFIASRSPDANPRSRRLDSSIPSAVSYFVSGDHAFEMRFDGMVNPSDVLQKNPHLPPFNFRWAAGHPKAFAGRIAAILLEERSRQPNGASSYAKAPTPTQDEIMEWLEDRVFSPYGILPAFLIDEPASKGLADAATATSIRRDFVNIAESYNDMMRSISYLGPLRSAPERSYLVAGGARESVGVRGEHMPQLLFRRRAEINSTVNDWFDRFEIPYKLRLKTMGDEVAGDIIAINLEDRRNGVTVAASDVGFGIGQLLPIIVEGLIGGGRILCVEQPEIHLHPRLQAHIADFLIATSKESQPVSAGGTTESRKDRLRPATGRPTQWIVESHSEALILRIQRRIREGLISPEDVSVLYVDPLGKSGSRVIRMAMDSNGDFFSEWPEGFFDESYTEWIAGR